MLLDDLLRFLHDLEDLRTQPEERLARSTRGGWLLADAAQIEAGLEHQANAAIERRAHRDDVIDRDDPVGMWGCDCGLGRLRAARRQAVELGRGDRAQRS